MAGAERHQPNENVNASLPGTMFKSNTAIAAKKACFAIIVVDCMSIFIRKLVLLLL